MNALLDWFRARPWWSAFLLGAASVLALPPVYAIPVLLLTIPAFLRLLGRAPDWRRAAWWGAGFGFGHQLAGLYWITHSLFTDIGRWFWLVPIAAPGIALPMALFTVIPAVIAWRMREGWPRVAGFAAAWVLAEMLRGVLFTGFPWNLLGTVWAFHPVPLQLASIIGVHGLSLLTVLVAGLPLLPPRRALAGGTALLALWMGFGIWRLEATSLADTAVRLVLVQGNVAQDLKWDPAQRMPIFERYLTLSADAAETEAEAHPAAPVLVIWPETASPFLLAQDPDAKRMAAEALPPRGILLAGTVRAEWAADGRLTTLYNSLVALDEGGQTLGIFDKSHLVPFGEYMPLGGIIPIRMVTGGADFMSGPGPMPLPLPGGIPSPGPLICYEVIFPGRVVGRERPGWLLNVTNDAWFGTSAGPYQHEAAARLRAVEEGLPMVRAAQTGISVVYDATGRQRARLPLGASGTVAAALPEALAPTPYARGGGWIPGLLLAGLLAGAALRSRT